MNSIYIIILLILFTAKLILKLQYNNLKDYQILKGAYKETVSNNLSILYFLYPCIGKEMQFH